jgi:hypothetical protein
MQNPKMSRHARQRLQQRGARPREVALVLHHGDIEIPANRGCRFVRLSHHAAALLQAQDSLTPQDVDRARRLMVLVDQSNAVVTVLKCDPQRRPRGANRLWRGAR